MSSSLGVRQSLGSHLEQSGSPWEGGGERKSPELVKFSQNGSRILWPRGAPPAGHFHGNRPDPKAGPLPLGVTIGQQAREPWPLGAGAPLSQPAYQAWASRRTFLPPPTGLQGAQTYLPGSTERGQERCGERRGAQRGPGRGEDWGGGQLQPLMSRVGQAGLAGSSTPRAAQRLARTASVRPAAAAAPGESYNGHWAGGWGPGDRPGGRGAAGSPEPSLFARFPSTMAAPLFPLLLLLLLGSPRSRLCLCLQTARPPSPGQQAPPPGQPAEAGPGTHKHSHSHTHRHTQRPPAPFLFSFSLPPSPLASPSLSQNEAPGRAEGGAAPTGPAPSLRGKRKRERREGASEGGRQGGLLRKTKERQRRGDWGKRGGDRLGLKETWMEGRPVGAGN